MEPIITVKGIGKKYTINHQRGGYVALRDVITTAFTNPFSFFKKKLLTTKEAFWALRDVDFEVMPGEVIGIIGRNGAGKSTLLKILSQITPPTTGEIRINGTVGSLLEVGTGFHPELTGRENIFLNGAILGMKKTEIVKKFDQIVEFAGIDQFLDTPVKYYSSGMYVRLAFSVAAHMDTDILIIDEVLAVGDAEFQKKCLGKMSEITKTEGRTILFVSHNLNIISDICKKVIILENGTIVKIEEVKSAIDFYKNRSEKREILSTVLTKNQISFKDFSINGFSTKEKISVTSGTPLIVECTVSTETPKEWINIGYGILKKQTGELIAFTHAELEGVTFNIRNKSTIKMNLTLPKLAPDDYCVEFHAWVDGKLIITNEEIAYFTIPATSAFRGGLTLQVFPSVIMANSDWSITDF